MFILGAALLLRNSEGFLLEECELAHSILRAKHYVIYIIQQTSSLPSPKWKSKELPQKEHVKLNVLGLFQLIHPEEFVDQLHEIITVNGSRICPFMNLVHKHCLGGCSLLILQLKSHSSWEKITVQIFTNLDAPKAHTVPGDLPR